MLFMVKRFQTFYFYPRSPCGERPGKGPAVKGYRNFYPRSPCGERPFLRNIIPSSKIFLSTLSLRRATCPFAEAVPAMTFLSTLSLRRATGIRRLLHGSESISIHALLAESDLDELCRMMGIKHFYPRSPCGERLAFRVFKSNCFSISIHALLAESDTRTQSAFLSL